MDIIIYLLMYLLPSIIAVVRRVRTNGSTNYGSIIVVNVLLGWTIIGWIVALTMAVRSVKTVRVIQ